MAYRNLTVTEVAERMQKPPLEVVARLRQLGIQVTQPEDEVETDEITALLLGRPPERYVPRRRHVQEEFDIGRLGQGVPSPNIFQNGQSLANLSSALGGGDLELIQTLRTLFLRNRQDTTQEVFVVHGHDDVRHTVASFISSLGLSPVMLDGKPNRGRTIIEKLEDHANASFAVVLLTPDDEGRKRNTKRLRPRARQNVILELGYFLAKLGRERVCALYVPGVEIPSDFHGILYVELDEGGSWRYPLYGELAAAGLPIEVRK